MVVAARIKIESSLYERVKKVAAIAGYESPDEFIVHVIERELEKLEADSDAEMTDRLKGLGYLE